MGSDLSLGKVMHSFIADLFGICRSITGEGVRETLRYINKIVPLNILEVPSGTEVFDWKVPDEWNIKDAWVKDSKGNKVIDFKKSNLHIVSYSIPFEGEVTLDELKKHLHTLPDNPEAIPYVASYYQKEWGFCLAYDDYKNLEDSKYYVKIDSTLEQGSMTYGELIIEGKTDKEILLSTYICHPSMANNELSGPAVTTFLAKHILEQADKPFYTYRILFLPETIGSILYLSMHCEEMIKNTMAGYLLTCLGDSGNLSYLQTRCENQLVDRVTMHVLANGLNEYKLYDYLDRGSDERQYNYPSINLPVGSLMRSKYREYPEYHTSKDNLNFVTPEALHDSLMTYQKCIDALEHNHLYMVTTFCEPHMSKYNLYPDRGAQMPSELIFKRMNILNYCDGEHDLLSIAEKLKTPIWELYEDIDILLENKLIKRVCN